MSKEEEAFELAGNIIATASAASMQGNFSQRSSVMLVAASGGADLPPIDPPGGGGDDGGMSNERIAALEARFDTVLPTLATKVDIAELKAEVHKGSSEQIRWIIGTAVAGLAVFITVMTFVLNNAVPRAPAQPAVVILSGQATGAGAATSTLAQPPAK